MKSFFVVIMTACCAIALIGCRGKADNKNQANANTSPTPSANTNANTAAQSTPLPEFTDPAVAYAEANKLFDANKTELAIEAYQQAVKLDPDFADAWFKLGVSYALMEKEAETKALVEEVVETPTPTPKNYRPPKNPKPGKKVAIVHNKPSEKAFEKAVAAYKKIIAKDSKNDSAFYNMGRAYNKLDEDEDSEKALREAVKLKPEETLYQTEFGSILIKLAKYDEAIKALKKALELDPENSLAEELLDKAQAGKKRIDFGSTPKPPTQQDSSAPRPKSGKSDSGASDSNDSDKPKPSDSKPESKPEKKPESKPTTPAKKSKDGN